jgi:hypothetical protein
MNFNNLFGIEKSYKYDTPSSNYKTILLGSGGYNSIYTEYFFLYLYHFNNNQDDDYILIDISFRNSIYIL